MATADTWSFPQYAGEVFVVGKNQTPFLSMAGGLNGGKLVTAFDFPMASTWSLDAAAQPAITETASLTAPATPNNYTRNQDLNTCQIYQETVRVSYKRQSTPGAIYADLSNNLQPAGTNELEDVLAHEINASLMQIALDAEYVFLQGSYVQATNAGTAAKTRGIITGITTNVTTSGSGAGNTVAKDDVDATLLSMFNNGAPMNNLVMFCDGAQKIKISNLYSSSLALADRSRTVGGVNIETLVTDFGPVGVVADYNMPSGTILIADMSVVYPVFCPVPGKGNFFYEELGKTGASFWGHIYGQMGLDYGPEEYHGKIVSLS